MMSKETNPLLYEEHIFCACGNLAMHQRPLLASLELSCYGRDSTTLDETSLHLYPILLLNISFKDQIRMQHWNKITVLIEEYKIKLQGINLL